MRRCFCGIHPRRAPETLGCPRICKSRTIPKERYFNSGLQRIPAELQRLKPCTPDAAGLCCPTGDIRNVPAGWTRPAWARNAVAAGLGAEPSGAHTQTPSVKCENKGNSHLRGLLLTCSSDSARQQWGDLH